MSTPWMPVSIMAGPRGIHLLRVLAQYLRDPWQTLKELVSQYGDPAWIQIGPYTLYVVTHPLYARQILEMDILSYGKTERYSRGTAPVVGQGLTAAISANAARRQMIEQLLSQSVAHLGEQIEQACSPTFALLDEHSRRPAPFDIWPELFYLNLRILGRVLLGLESEPQIRFMGESLTAIRHISNQQFNAPISLPANWPTPQNRRFRAANRAFRGAIEAALANPQASLPNLATALRDQRQTPFAESQIEDEIVSLLFAGCEDPPNSLAWALALLALAPAGAERLLAELVSHPEPMTSPYLQAVLHETWRLYPPTWGVLRDLTRPADLGSYQLEQGGMVFLAFFLTHRHPDFWPEPEKFKPERFLPPNNEARHPYAFLPFGAGERACVAQNFAQPLIALALAQIFQRYRVQLAHEALPRPEATHSLRPRHGLWVTLSAR